MMMTICSQPTNQIGLMNSQIKEEWRKIKEETGFIYKLDMIEPKSRNISVYTYPISIDLASIVSKTCNPPLECPKSSALSLWRE